MRNKNSRNTPLEIYHGVPKGWSKDELIKRYHRLGGQGSITAEEATEPGAPSWMADRYNWLQYRATLYKIADGLKVNDPVCIELDIEYIELNYFGSYSGYIRERLARLLKNANLEYKQAVRIKRHIQTLRDNGKFLYEFREYLKLEKRIIQTWPKCA